MKPTEKRGRGGKRSLARDIISVILIVVPFLGAAILDVLTKPASDGIDVTGAQVYFTVKMPIQDLYITEAQVTSFCVMSALLGLCLFLTNGLSTTGTSKRQLAAELIVTKDMTERKTKMIELGDVFIAFPGGTGTLEEIAEVMSKVSLKHLEAPCILYNLNCYYDSLKALLSHMTEKGLSSPERQEGIYFAKDLSEIRKIIENQRSNATTTPPENTQGIGNQLG